MAQRSSSGRWVKAIMAVPGTPVPRVAKIWAGLSPPLSLPVARLVGVGLSAAAAAPSPVPPGPWQEAQFISYDAVPLASSSGVFLGSPARAAPAARRAAAAARGINRLLCIVPPRPVGLLEARARPSHDLHALLLTRGARLMPFGQAGAGRDGPRGWPRAGRPARRRSPRDRCPRPPPPAAPRRRPR